MRRRRAVLVAAVLAVTGCGLPLTDGASSPRPDDRNRAAGIKVLPPGPQPGATPEGIVRGFLNAQNSPDDDHAVAREFLVPGTEWDDDRGVVLYRPGSLQVTADADDPLKVRSGLEQTAQISEDGAYRLLPAEPEPEEFLLQRLEDGELRLSQVPAGLRLQAGDVGRSFVPREVFFLGRSSLEEVGPRLVPDRVFLPVTVEPAEALVGALLGGASGLLLGAVDSAVPDGTTAVDVAVSDDRIVTVDLTGPLDDLTVRDRQRMSAQLVWTLQEYAGVRLLVDGRPYDVAPVGDLQTVDDWTSYDPDVVSDQAPLYYVDDRRLAVLDGPLGEGDATSGDVPVDEVAVDPAGARLGVVSVGRGRADDTVRIGGLEGPLGGPVLQRPDLGSLSWGSGDRGLWLLERGAEPRVWVLRGPGTRPLAVPVTTPLGAGPLARIEVSRDGARIALVFGTQAQRRLYVGRIEPTATGLEVDDVRLVAPDLTDVTDVAWENGTSLVVLARDASAAGLLVLKVAVDGSSSAPLQRQGLLGVPQAVAAAPGRPLVVAAGTPGEAVQLFRDEVSALRPKTDGRAPSYPG